MPRSPTRVLPTGISLNPYLGNYATGGIGHRVHFNVSSFGSPYTTFAIWFVPYQADGRMLFGMNRYGIYFSCGGVGVNTGADDVYGFSFSPSQQAYLLAVALTYNYPDSANPVKMWLNGSPQTLSQLCGKPASATVSNPVRLGGWTTQDEYQLSGVIVHFFVWNRLLSDSEVQQLYNCGWQNPCPPTNGLIHWIGPDGTDRVGNTPVYISNARPRWWNTDTGDGLVYAEIYRGATTSSEPPSSDYTFVNSVIIPIDLAWFGYGSCTINSRYAEWNTAFLWQMDSQMPYWVTRLGGPKTGVALVYQMNVYLPQSGTYTIEWISDDGFRLYIDGKLVVDDWRPQGPSLKSTKYDLSSGWHTFTVKWFEGSGCWALFLGLVMPDGTPIRPLTPVYGIKIRPAKSAPYYFNIYAPSRILQPTR